MIESEAIKNGYKRMSGLNVSICSIVRDCERNLKRNIIRIEKLRKCFLDSEVVIFENDSKDRTAQVVENWKQNSDKIIFKSENYHNKTIPNKTQGANPFFSKHRIEKLSYYRNKYLEIINSNEFRRDYVIIIDLDIANFSIDGIAHSFGLDQNWSCITSNGTSLSRTLKRQYHDSYALLEKGSGAFIMNEKIITANRVRFSFLKYGMPLFAVDSAFGGLAIYDWKALSGKYYSCLRNDDQRVEVLCEHISLNRQLEGNIFINPCMRVKYRSFTISFILKQLRKHYLKEY